MRINHLGYVPSGSAKRNPEGKGLDAQVSSGAAVDVTRQADAFFPAGRVAITSDAYERFVAWPSQAMREHGLFVDERERLEALLRAAAASMRHASPAEFTCRVRDTKGDAAMNRHCFVLERFDDTIETGWVIRL